MIGDMIEMGERIRRIPLRAVLIVLVVCSIVVMSFMTLAKYVT